MLEYFKQKYDVMPYSTPKEIEFWNNKFRVQISFSKRWYDEEWRETCLLTVMRKTDTDVCRDFEQIITLILDPTVERIELYINILKEKLNAKNN